MSGTTRSSSKNSAEDERKTAETKSGSDDKSPNEDKSKSNSKHEVPQSQKKKPNPECETHPACHDLPQFLHTESQPEIEGMNPKDKRTSELILPAAGLEESQAMAATSSLATSSSSVISSSSTTGASNVSSANDNDPLGIRENIVTERIRDPDQLLDTIRAALLTCKLPSSSTNICSKQNHNAESTETETQSDLKEHVEKIIEYRHLIRDLTHGQENRPTDLVKLQKLPKAHGLRCEVWIKCEYQNLSGSSKYRVATLMLAELDKEGENTTTIITHTSANFTMALAMANTRMKKNHRIMSVLPERVSGTKRTILQGMGVKIFRAPEESSDNNQATESATMMAKFLREKIKDSVIFDPFDHPLSVQTHYLWTGREILEQFSSIEDCEVDMLVCGYETGGMISALSPLFKETFSNCTVIGVDLSGQLTTVNNEGADGNSPESRSRLSVDPDTIFVEEFASPSLSSILNIKAADKWYQVSVKDATNMTRTMILQEGIPVTPTSGAILHAAISAAKEFNIADKKEAKILLVIDNFALYTDFDLGSNDWLVSRNYTTNLEIETTKWFHLMYCGRIPVKVPVTVFNDFNATAVYNMMKKDGIDRVIVQDSKTNAILGVTSFDHLARQLEDGGGLTQGDLIGDKNSVCPSFQTICINNNISALFELFKTNTYAILIQRQKFISATRGRLDQDWIAGILDILDLVKFISEIEQRHGEKFGANLCGGFYRPKPEVVVEEEKNTDSLAESLSLKSADLVIGQHLKETIVMTATTCSEEASKPAEFDIPPPDINSVEFSESSPSIDSPSEPESIAIVTTIDNSSDNAYRETQQSVQTAPPRLLVATAQVSSGFTTPASVTSEQETLLNERETAALALFTPTRYHSMHHLENLDDGSLSQELDGAVTSDTDFPVGLEYSSMTLGDSIMSAWYSSGNEPVTLSDPGSQNSNVLMADDDMSSVSNDTSSDVLLSIQSLPQMRIFSQFQRDNQEGQNDSSSTEIVHGNRIENQQIQNQSQDVSDGGNSNVIVLMTREQEELVAPVLSQHGDPLLNASILNALPIVGTSLEAAAAQTRAQVQTSSLPFVPGQNQMVENHKEPLGYKGGSSTIIKIKTIESAFRISKDPDSGGPTTNPTGPNPNSTSSNPRTLKESPPSLDNPDINIQSSSAISSNISPSSKNNSSFLKNTSTSVRK